jgi:uncharacterized protein YcbK (DUF882 family)
MIESDTLSSIGKRCFKKAQHEMGDGVPIDIDVVFVILKAVYARFNRRRETPGLGVDFEMIVNGYWKKCRWVRWGTGWISWLLLALTITVGTPVFAMKTKIFHTVKPGDSIAKIADFYGVAQRDLRELNSLKEGRPLKVGMELKIPNVLRVSGKKHLVQEGDTLASIGEKYKQSPKAIAAANKMTVDDPLTVGRMLVIPDNSHFAKSFKAEGGSPHTILFLRVRTGERERLSLYSKNGSLNYKSVQTLSHLARDKRDGKVKRLHYRLIHMLQALAEAYPGKPIEIISGYRAQSTGDESQHAFGRAMDLRVPGVSVKAVFQFCRTLPRSGCGYYPNSGFVHMDARSRKTFWIDRSSTGGN